jgi:hypothetical protein
VPANATFEAIFSDDVDPTTINVNTIKVIRTSDNAPWSVISPAIDSINGKKVTFSVTDMTKNKAFKIQFMDTIASKTDATKTLGSVKEYTFNTANKAFYSSIFKYDGPTNTTDVAIIRNEDIQDAVGAGVDSGVIGAGIFVNFDSALAPASVNNTTVKFYNVTDGSYVSIAVGTNAATDYAASPVNNFTANKHITVKFLEALTAGKNYELQISGMTTTTGLAVEDFLWPITYGSTAPTVTISSLDNNAINQAAYANAANDMVTANLVDSNSPDGTALPGLKFYATFAVAMKDASVTADKFSVKKVTSDTDTGVAVDCVFEYSSTLKRVTLTPKANLEEGKIYRFTVSKEVQNSFGEKMAADSKMYFQTYDFTAPTVTSVDGAITNLNVGVQNSITINFSEPIGYRVGTVVTDASPQEGDDGIQDANSAVVIRKAGVSATAPGADVIAIDSVTRSTDKKSITVKFTPATGDKGKTFILTLSGKHNTNEHISDISNGAANGNPLASDYAISFTTVAIDTAAPVVDKVFYTSDNTYNYTTNTAITADMHNVSSKDIFVVFNKLMNTAASKTTIDNAGNQALASKNVQLQVWSGTTWGAAAVDNSDDNTGASGGAVGAGYIDFYNDNVNSKSYLKIANGDILADRYYKLVLTPTATANGIEDASGNDMLASYSITFYTGDGPDMVIEPEATDTITEAARTVGYTTAGSIAGATTITTAGAFAGADDANLAIELANGQFFFTTQNGAEAANVITFDDALPYAVETGATVADLTSPAGIDGTVDQFKTGHVVSDPIAIRINGSATAKIDSGSLSTGVKLYKQSDNSVVSANITYKLVNSDQDAYVSIDPVADLDGNTTYYINVKDVKDLLGNPVSGNDVNLKITFTTAVVANRVALSDFNINDNQMSVPVGTNISFKVANTALTKTQIEALYQDDQTANQDNRIVIYDAAGADHVAALSTYDASTGVLTIDPTVNLAGATTYVLSIDDTAFGTGGYALSANKQITFRTGTAAGAKILSAKHISAGAAGLDGDQLIIKFDSKIGGVAGTDYPAADGSDINDFFTLTDATLANTTNVTATSLSADGKTLVCTLATAGAGYILDGVATIAPQAALLSKDTDAGVACDTTTAVTIAAQ